MQAKKHENKGGRQMPEGRSRAVDFFSHVERGFYIAVAGALAIAGALLFGHVVYRLFSELGNDLSAAVLDFLDGLLLVFIVTELLHTVRAVIDEDVLKLEPFLVVGVVAGIRRLIVITAEAQEQVGKPDFGDLMVEMGVLIAAMVILGLTIFLVRRSEATPQRTEVSTAQ